MLEIFELVESYIRNHESYLAKVPQLQGNLELLLFLNYSTQPSTLNYIYDDLYISVMSS